MRRRVWVLLAVLAGLFAMHGLADHGATAGPHAEAAVVQHHGHHEPPADDDQHHSGHGLVGLCVAVLGAALLWLLGGTVGRRVAAPCATLARAVRSASRAARARAPDPPDLLALSVVRC